MAPSEVVVVPSAFGVRFVEVGSQMVVRLSGEADAEVRDLVVDAIAAASQASPAGIVVDLGELTFIDSSGIHALVLGRDRCLGRGTEMAVARPSASVRRVLDLCGLSRLLGLEPVGG